MEFRNFRLVFCFFTLILFSSAIPNSLILAETTQNLIMVNSKLSEPAQTIVFYVAETGDDENPGSVDLPFATIQHAIKMSSNGDEVCVQPGTYTGQGNRDIDFLGKGITVRSCTGDPATTIIDCQGSVSEPHRGFWFHTGEDSTSILQSITVTGGGGVSYGGGILIGDPANAGIVAAPIIQDCFIIQNEAQNGAGIAILTAALIRNCDVENNTGSGLYLGSYNGTEISDSRMVGNSSNGAIGVWGEWISQEAILFGPRMVFESCEFSGNGQDGFFSGQPHNWIYLDFNDCHFSNNAGWGLHTQASEDVFVTVNGGSAKLNTLGGIRLWIGTSNSISNCIVETNLGPGIVLKYLFLNPVNGCTVSGNSGHGISFGGAKSAPPDNKKVFMPVSSCEIWNNGGRGININSGIPWPAEISDCFIFANVEEGIGVNSPCAYEECQLDITYCTIVGNGVAGVSYCSDVPINIRNVILAYNLGPGVLCCGTEIPTLECCDIYGNEGGDWTGIIAPQLGINGNISLDPRFCREVYSDNPYTLTDDSPCAEDYNPGCGPIGSFGVGCSALPIIESIMDVGNDQGRQVRISWFRSAYDQAESSFPVIDYGVYRRLDEYNKEPINALVGDKFAGWDFIARVPARQDSFYHYVAPTLCDSTISGGLCLSTFIISAMTSDPGLYFDSLPDSGYSVDNLSPAMPEELIVNYSSEQNVLTWTPSPDPDLSNFLVYRTLESEGPPPDEAVPFANVSTATWTDENFGTGKDAWDFRYWVAAVDYAGNRSLIASPNEVTDVGNWSVPTRTALHSAVPNPFNPRTTISFDLAMPTTVDLRLFDISGRMIKSLINSETRPPGLHSVTWTGQDDSGRSVAAGVYFIRLQAGEFLQTRRMTLMK